jgi:hypothetical protein
MRGILQALAAAVVVGMHATALAGVCGDANGDGNVSVSDGVQTLRAAAGLGSQCDTDCDIDGSGAITVSDGVNVLRKAAGLAVTDACPGGDPVSSLIGHTIDVFGPITKVGAVGGAAAAGTSSPCDNPEGGFQQNADGFIFDDCRIGNVSFTGFLGRSASTLSFDNLAVTRNGDVLTLVGSLNVGDAGGNPELNGVLNGDSRVLGAYVITYQQVVTGSQGETLDGVLVFDTSDANLGDVVEVRVTLTTGTALPVLVTHADDSTQSFTYNPNTDVLTPTTTPPAARVRLFNIDDTITAFLNGKQVLQASSTGPGATQNTGFQTVAGLECGDNTFEFRVTNNPGGGGYTFGVQLEIDGTLAVNRTCGQVGVQGCDGNNTTVGEVARDVTFICVPCGPCTAGAGTCAAPIQIPSSGRIQIHGRVAGANNLSGPCGGAGGPESVFRFTPDAQVCVEFSTCGTTFDSQLSLGDAFCGGNGPIVEQCLDDNQSCIGGGAHEASFGSFSPGQPVTFLLDSQGSQGGSYTFDIRPSGQCLF